MTSKFPGVIGNLSSVTITPGNVAATNFDLAVSNGEVPGWSSHQSGGKSVDLTTGTIQTIWDANPPNSDYIPPTTDRIHNISSSSIEDSATGTGVSIIIIQGVNTISDGITSEFIQLLGTTIVPTVNVYTCIHSMITITWGSSAVQPLAAIGNIQAVAQIDGTISAQMNIGRNTTLTTVFQVPRNKNYLIPNVTISISRATGNFSADFRTSLFNQGGGIIESIELSLVNEFSNFTIEVIPPVTIPPLTYIMVQVAVTTTVTVSAIHRGYLAPLPS